MAFTIKENISWVGKVDWELRTFHGQELSTHRGSSYNSYLVRDTKTALIDTVWGPFSGGFVENLKKEIALNAISFLRFSTNPPENGPHTVSINAVFVSLTR